MSEQGIKKLDLLVARSRLAQPEWTPARERRVFSDVKRTEITRDARGKKALVAISLVAAAALFCVRAAAGNTDTAPHASESPTIAAGNDALGLGDAGLFAD